MCGTYAHNAFRQQVFPVYICIFRVAWQSLADCIPSLIGLYYSPVLLVDSNVFLKKGSDYLELSLISDDSISNPISVGWVFPPGFDDEVAPKLFLKWVFLYLYSELLVF